MLQSAWLPAKIAPTRMNVPQPTHFESWIKCCRKKGGEYSLLLTTRLIGSQVLAGLANVGFEHGREAIGVDVLCGSEKYTISETLNVKMAAPQRRIKKQLARHGCL